MHTVLFTLQNLEPIEEKAVTLRVAVLTLRKLRMTSQSKAVSPLPSDSADFYRRKFSQMTPLQGYADTMQLLVLGT